MQRHFLPIFLSILASVLYSSCATSEKSNTTTEIESILQQIWQDADSATVRLNAIEPSTLSQQEHVLYDMAKEHINLRLHHDLHPELLSADAHTLQNACNMRYLAELYYIEGSECIRREDPYLSTECLKKAESILQDCDTLQLLKGMIYYRLGQNFETDHLYQTANDYYNLALPLLEQTNHHLYMACCYRELGRTIIGSTEQKQEFFGHALQEAKLSGDTLLQLDILDFAGSYDRNRDIVSLLQINLYLCNKMHQTQYASEIAEYYLQASEADSAWHYIMVYAADTALSAYSQQQYRSLHSRWQAQFGDAKSAYKELSQLFEEQRRQLVADGSARTYAIAKQYDVLKEKEQNLQLQLKNQRLYLIIAMLLVIVLFAILLYARIAMRHKITEATNLQLQNELQTRRDSLRQVLAERVRLSKDLQISEMIQSQKKDLPNWVNQFVEQNLYTTAESWNSFQKQFNNVSNNFLDYLKGQYPMLTKADLQIITFILLDCSVQDICILLSQSKHTVWSRRQRIKTHIGLGTDITLDDWLRRELETYDKR